MSKERILSIVSHDLRAPLTSIQGFLELLSEHWDKLDADQGHEFLRRSLARSAQMQRMLADLLDASRHEHLATAPHPRDVPVADVLHDIVSGLSGAGDEVIVAHVEGRVHADPVHLGRIAANLIDNARKYGAPPVEVSAHQDGQQVHIRVRDHGDGIPDSFAPKLFTAFAQAHPETHAGNGIGLGLSIVNQLARQNGGTVAYEPAPDGACFVVTLPAASDRSSHVE